MLNNNNNVEMLLGTNNKEEVKMNNELSWEEEKSESMKKDDYYDLLRRRQELLMMRDSLVSTLRTTDDTLTEWSSDLLNLLHKERIEIDLELCHTDMEIEDAEEANPDLIEEEI